jgi:hypothetical protein
MAVSIILLPSILAESDSNIELRAEREGVKDEMTYA